MATEAWQRLPLKAVAAISLRGVPSVASLVFAGFLYGYQPQLWPGPLAVYLIASLLIIRLVHPIYAWSTLRYAISEDSFVLTRGLIFRTTRTTSWRNVSVVDISSPWAFRRFGLGTISLRSGGQDDTKIDVPGIEHKVLDAIVELVRAHRTLNSQIAPSGSTATGIHNSAPELYVKGRPVLYTARKRDLVTANLIYGHVVALGTAAIITVADLASQLEVLDGVLHVLTSHPWSGGIVLGGAVLFVGSVASLVKYHGFTVTGDSAGLTISYGWLSTNHRDVKSSAVGGITARRNLIEMFLDRARVAILTTDSDAQMGTNMVLPSLPRLQVTQILTSSLPELPRPALLDSSGRASIAKSLAIFATVGALSLASGWVLHQLVGGGLILDAMGSALICSVLAMAVRRARAEISVVGASVGWASHSFADQEMVLAATSLHSVSAASLRTTKLSLVRAHYFAGRPKTLAALSFSPAVPHQIGQLVTESAPKIAVHRQRSTVKHPTAKEYIHDPR